MSYSWDFDTNCWYMTNDYQDLYSIRKEAPGEYMVCKYYNCEVVWRGTLNDCKHYMNTHCMNHSNFINRKGGNDGE